MILKIHKEWVIAGNNSDQIEKVINNAYEAGNIKSNKIVKVSTDRSRIYKNI